ncbi:MAG: rod shape-determining protein MreC [Pseudomonadota bacterium]|nr:rod shape-determining protein MreC [Pseudomonadota bacterium]
MLIPKKYQFVIVIVAAIAVSVVILVIGAKGAYDTALPRKIILDVAAPMESILRAPLDGIAEIWSRYLFLVGTGEENRRLKKENDQLKNQLLQYQEGYLEGVRLQKLLALKERSEYESVPARIIGIDQKSLLKTILINRGSAHGIRKGLPVINEQGILGRIVETSWHVSRVLLISDGNSNVDAAIQGSRAQGILQGTGAGRCALKYIAKTEEVKEGDMVVSSGMTEIFPKGLLLGSVIRADKKAAGLFQTIEVAPAVDFSRMEEALVLVVPEVRKK